MLNAVHGLTSKRVMPIRSLRWFLTLLATVGVIAVVQAQPATGARAPEIGKNDMNGHSLTMRGLRGKVVIVDFWASWCDPCREEMPVLERLYQQYKDHGLVVIGVSVDRTVGNVRGFLNRTPVSFPIVHDADHQLADRYQPPRMPSSYIIDRRGVVRHVHEGFQSGDAATIEREVRRLLE